MKKTLINHGGIIQWKFLISNDDELMKYAKYKSIEIGEEFRTLINKNYKQSDKPDTQTQKALKLTSTIHRVPLVSSCDVLLKELILSMHKMVLKGQTLVVNEAGGYCPWDEKEMERIEETEENVAIANGTQPRNKIQTNLNDGPILVLENQSEIPERVEDYIHLTLGIPKFSYIKNIQFEKQKLPLLIKEALEKKHHTIVVQSALMDDSQVIMVAELLEKIPGSITFLINSTDNLQDVLNCLIGEDRTEALYQKHKIVRW